MQIQSSHKYKVSIMGCNI